MDGNAGFLSLIPPILAIVLALATKEVIFSLIVGVISGTTIYAIMTHIGFTGIFTTTATIMSSKLADNTSMILFLCFLGILITLISKSGGIWEKVQFRSTAEKVMESHRQPLAVQFRQPARENMSLSYSF